jgi:hypothetical protein
MSDVAGAGARKSGVSRQKPENVSRQKPENKEMSS